MKTLFFVFLCSFFTFSGFSQSLKVNDTDFSKGRLGNIQTIDIQDLSKFHGHLCDGLVEGFVALEYGLYQLFPDSVIDRTNLRIVSKSSPCIADVAVYLTGARYQYGNFYVSNDFEGMYILQRIDHEKTINIRRKPNVKPAIIDQMGKLAIEGKLSACDLEKLRALENQYADFLASKPARENFEIKIVENFVWQPTLKNDFVKTDVLNKNMPKCADTARQVIAVSAMKKVMMGKDLSTHLLWDSIPHQNLFGISPLGRIEGEITILDGEIFVSKVNKKGQINLTQNWQSEAPFGVYAHVKSWKKIQAEVDFENKKDLHKWIEKTALQQGYNLQRAFAFRIKGNFKHVDFHVISKPKKEKVHNHQLHKKAKKHFTLQNSEGELLGFYSQKHEGIFTHKGSFVHTHFIDQARKNMGHLEDIRINGKITLFLPK